MKFNIAKALSEEDIIGQCKLGKRFGQQELYSRYSSKMFGICLRYIKNKSDAEDVLITSFTKIFQKINQYEGNGSFEGWIKKITVNEALMHLRKSRNLFVEVELENFDLSINNSVIESSLEADDLIKMIDRLPTGYKTIFNLYAIEGYAHREIADMLGISESTSKSQLSRARVLLQKYLGENEFFFNRSVADSLNS